MKKLALHWQILGAIVLAIGAGLLTGTEAEIFGVSFLSQERLRPGRLRRSGGPQSCLCGTSDGLLPRSG